MKFRKKPMVVDAVQWQCSIESEYELQHFGATIFIEDNPDHLRLITLEGPMIVKPWSWIIKGVKGEFWAVREDIFAETYEPVNE